MVLNLLKPKFILFIVLFSTDFATRVAAQDPYQAQRQDWLKKAEDNKPQLSETDKYPVSLVKLEKDANAFQGWKATAVDTAGKLYSTSFKNQSGVIVDFGEHLTGYLTFSLKALKGTPDAPVRLRFTFGEVPSELAVPFDPYKGTLSRAWLQDEIV